MFEDIHFYEIVNQVINTSWLEWTAVIFGIIQVILAKDNKVLLYPAGIISTTLTIYIMSQVGLYAEAFLNLYYLVMSIYGWAYWLHRKDRPAPAITRAHSKDWLICSSIMGFGFLILYLILDRLTDSTVPIWDSFVSATAWAGMWLLAKRKLENWILLNISNFLAIPLLIYKGLELFSVLTLILFIVAIFGYFNWLRIYRSKKLNQLESHP